MQGRNWKRQVAAGMLGFAAVWASGLSAFAIEGRVAEVTLYRGQAQVTRVAPIEGPAGGLEVVVTDLPEQIVPDSLFAEGDQNVEIRAVRFRTRAVGEEPREEVRALDEQILETQQQILLTQKRTELLGKRTSYLDRMETFAATTANADLSQGVLDAEALQQITVFAFQQRDEIAEQEVGLQRQTHELNEQLQLLQRKRAEITSGASHTVREAVLFLQKQGDQPAEVRLNYLVNGCGWSPTYTMRAGGERQQVSVEYNALIHQITGESWDNVQLTLSTASPSLAASGPGLAPFHVTLQADVGVGANEPAQGQQPADFFGNNGRGYSRDQVLDNIEGLNRKKMAVQMQAGNAVDFSTNSTLSWDLNTFACASQQLEINGDAVTLSVLRSETGGQTEGPSLSYQLHAPVSLASRSDQQMVRIMQTDMDSRFYHVATPVLSPYVYREAELMNASEEDLLAGPITVYLDGRFVGRGEIPTVARGQTFVVGFGANPQLRTRRELASREDDIQGGNREMQFEYRLFIENFSAEATKVRLVDRLPHAEGGVDIRITLGDTSEAISEDRQYQRIERPMGLLRWDVDVPGGAAGDDARLIEYGYTVEFDRKYLVSLPSSSQALQEEFERLQRDRQKR